MLSKTLLIIAFLAGLSRFMYAGDTARVAKLKLMGLPVLYYDPESQWGGGAAGVLRFKTRHEPDSMRYSNIMFATAVTQLGQVLLSAPFQFWLDKEKYNIYGEAAYLKYNFLYYGIGNNVAPNYSERYYIDFPRFRLAALKRIYPHLYAGVRYTFDNSTLLKLDTAGQLIKGDIAGSKGGVVSGAGLTVKFDNRDNQFYATKGYYVECFALTNGAITGSNYTFSKYSIDASAYIALPFKQVLAFNAFGAASTGDVPFYHMTVLGGSNKMRGYYTGRYRDKDGWVLQAEYRVHLFWRLGAVAFAGIGGVAPQVDQFNGKYTRVAWGAGFRAIIDKKQHLNIRLDAGMGGNTLNYYFTIGEAF
jgi:outer membrane protein assembly factor BamA